MEFIIAYDIFGCEIALGKGYGRAASPESKEMGKKWFEGTMQGLLDRRRVRSHPVKVVGSVGKNWWLWLNEKAEVVLRTFLSFTPPPPPSFLFFSTLSSISKNVVQVTQQKMRGGKNFSAVDILQRKNAPEIKLNTGRWVVGFIGPRGRASSPCGTLVAIV